MFLQLGWSTFVQFVGLFLTLRYHFTANEVGVFLGCIGAGFTGTFFYLLNIVVRHFLLAIIMINNELSAWVLSVPAATGLAIAYSVLTTMFSNQAGANKQGWIMGLTGAIGAFSFGITGLIAGIMVDYSETAPIWLAFVFLLLSAAVITFSLFKPNKS